MTEQVFYIMDIQDTTNNWETTLQGVKTYIIDFWSENDYEDEEFETEEQWNDFVDMVESTDDPEQLDECLQGFGYTLFTSEKEMYEWIEEFGL